MMAPAQYIKIEGEKVGSRLQSALASSSCLNRLFRSLPDILLRTFFCNKHHLKAFATNSIATIRNTITTVRNNYQVIANMRYSSLLSIVFGTSLAAAAPAHSAKRGSPGKHHPGWHGGHHGHGSTGEPAAVAKHRAAAVKEAFEFAWDGYYKYANSKMLERKV